MPPRPCPDCDHGSADLSRRRFLQATGGALLAAGSLPALARPASAAPSTSQPESLVKMLFETLSPKQREAICFDWDYQDDRRGLLRTRVANNWNITEQEIVSDFYTDEQRDLVRKIFEGIIQPEWHARIDRQLEDDAGGFGHSQSIALFGRPGEGKFEFVMTGRHMTLRCDGNSADHVAFGGPIFYGHDAGGTFNEDAGHPGNVFWHQAVHANKLYQMLDGKQQKLALVDRLPREPDVAFRGERGQRPGIPASELSRDQFEHLEEVLRMLVEPYRQNDRDEVVNCLKARGGLEQCSLAFYREGDIGRDGVWDCWRLEGPAFVWYFRGAPHVHVWVHVADSPSVPLNS